jgi:hypothetical protein
LTEAAALRRTPFAQGGADVWLRIAAIVTVILGVTLWAGPALWRSDIIDDDANQHIFWLYRYADPALFPHDITVDYFRTSAPLGYRGLYALIAPWFDVLQAAKVLAAALLVACGWLSWGIATSIEGRNRNLRGLVAVAALVGLVAVDRSSGGILWVMAFQRSFALPVLLLFLWALQSRRYLWVGISWLCAALFYPVALPVLGLTGGYIFSREWLQCKRLPRYWPANCLMGIGALALALLGLPESGSLGPAYTYAEAANMPEFGPNGRLQLYATGLITNLLRYHMTGLGWAPLPLLAIGLCVGLAWIAGQRRLITPVAWATLVVGVGLWAAMRLFPEQLMFGLYLPNRHARWAIAGFGIVAIPAGAASLVGLGERFVAGGTAHWNGIVARIASLLVPLAVAALLLPYAIQQLRSPADRDLERVYSYLAMLPKNTLIGAHPDLADYIPLRTRRSVLGSTEGSMPWMAGFYRVVKPRIEASLRAAYATDLATLDREMASQGVKVFVTGPIVWQSQGYFEPYDPLVRALRARGGSAGFALAAPPSDRVLFSSGAYYVLRIGDP